MAINKRFTQLNNSGSNHDLLDAYTGKITGSFEVTGAAYFPGGLSGSLQMLTDGTTMFLTGAGGITITNLANGQIEVSGAAPAASAASYWDSVVNGVIYTTASMVEMAHLSASNGAEVTGSLFVASGNALETLQIDWNKIELGVGANSALTIKNTNQNIVLDADVFALEVTASKAVFVGAGGITVGSDAAFFVSGSDGTNSGNKAVFGGTTFTSGNMQLAFDSKLQSRNFASNDFANLVQLADASGLGYGNNVVVFGDSSQTSGFGFLDPGGPAPAGVIALITGSNEGFFSGSYKFPQGITGSITKLTDGSDYLIAGTGITLTTGSNGSITIDSTSINPQWYYTANTGEIATSGSAAITGSLTVNPAGTGRGLLNFGGLDIGPITGSMVTIGTPPEVLGGNILSASAGTWDGTNAVVLRHEFHIVGMEQYGGDMYAATYLVSSRIDTGGTQYAIGATELSREIYGAASDWDVNIESNMDVTVTGSNGKVVYWYAQRTKEMSVNMIGDRT